MTRTPLTDRMPSVSVVIPTRNRWSWVADAVASAHAQRDVQLDVVVIDDSSDATVPKDLAASGISLIRQSPHAGVAAARNRGAEAAAGDWIAFLDDDDLWAPDHVSSLVGACEACRADFGYSASWVVDERRRVLWQRPAPPPARLGRLLELRNAIGSPSGVVVRADFWRRTGGFDTTLAAMADWDLWFRWAGTGTAATTNKPTLAYTEHPANMSLDMQLVLREFETLKARYGGRSSADSGPMGGDGFPRWVARSYRRMGMRRHASAWYLRSAWRGRRPADVLRAAGILLGEPVMNLVQGPALPSPSQPIWLTPRP